MLLPKDLYPNRLYGFRTQTRRTGCNPKREHREKFNLHFGAIFCALGNMRDAALLGLPLPDLRWFSRALGLGHKEFGSAAQTVFTYKELKRLSSEAATSDK
jgi:hypothetical protein